MNFEGFKDLVHRVVGSWWKVSKKELIEIDLCRNYLQQSPFKAEQTADNETAYESLMDVRCKLYEISREIDSHHDAYMDFMNQCLETPDLMEKVTVGLTVEEKHLVHLEFMIMEQVEDWEMDIGKINQESTWTKNKRLVVNLPDGRTRTIGISQEAQKRYWFGICPVSSKIGNLKMCGGCKMVGYVGKEEQKEDWPKHKALCNVLQSLHGKRLSSEKVIRLLEQNLGTLSQYELDVANHPRVCMVCGSDDYDKLKTCKKCFCVTFCHQHVEVGRERHDANQMCSQLRMAAEDYRNEQTLGHQVQNYVPKTVKGNYAKLPDNIEAFFLKDVSDLVSNKLPGYQDSELRYLTFLYTCPLSTLYGMEVAGVGGRPVEQRKELTVHLVGSRIAELRHLIGWEIIAHRLPKLKSLTIVFVGDECPSADFPRDFTWSRTWSWRWTAGLSFIRRGTRQFP